MPRTLRAAFAALVLAVMAGCGAPPEGTVSGTVKMDGEPLKEGIIRFEPTDKAGTPKDVPITDGKYSVQLTPGEAKVIIRANKVVGQAKMYGADGPTVDKTVELIDAQFNDHSTQKYTITAGGQTKDWEVKKRK